MKKVAIIMGSSSDYPTMEKAKEIFDAFFVPYVIKVVSAHRTPKMMFEFAKNAHENFDLIIAGAGGAAHLPGMVASITTLPVIGVPIESKTLKGVDSLLSICQMPKGVPVATMAIGEAGAINAALLAIAIFSINDPELLKKLIEYRETLKLQVEQMSKEFEQQ